MGAAPGTLDDVRVAVIDLGSNSFRLLVADVRSRGGIEPVLREREMLHLGGALDSTGSLGDKQIGAAVSAAGRLHGLANRTGAEEVVAVATSAIRSATNRTEILEQLGEVVGSDVRVLDGVEEARLGFIGVAASVALPAEPHLVADLGGGSLEIAIGRGATVEWSTSQPLGVTRLHAEFVGDDPMPSETARAIRDHVKAHLASSMNAATVHGAGAAAAVGGPVRAIARVVARRTLGWTPANLNQFYLTVDETRLTMEDMLSRTAEQRNAVPGVKESRAEQMATAAVIVHTLMESLGFERLWVSYWGLREGLIIDEFGDDHFPLGNELRNTSVSRTALRFVPDATHSEHVAHLANSLFAQTRRLHELTERDRELMLNAARLHSIGISVAFNGYARHSAYLVEHSELRGFSPNEIALLASLVRFHRRGSPSTDYAPYANLTKASRSRVDALIGLLHLADVLDRPLDQSVADVEVRHDAGTIHVRLIGNNPSLRREWVDRAARSIRLALDVELVIDDDQLDEF